MPCKQVVFVGSVASSAHPQVPQNAAARNIVSYKYHRVTIQGLAGMIFFSTLETRSNIMGNNKFTQICALMCMLDRIQIYGSINE